MADPDIVLLGAPASGKGTQGRKLAQELNLSFLSTGKQLRREVEAGSELGREAEGYLAQGQYVPDSLALAIALKWLRKATGGWVLDGFPRTLAQAQELDDFLKQRAQRMKAILLEIHTAELERRVRERRECVSCSWTGTREQAEEMGSCPSCGGKLVYRSDDNLQNFRNRHQAFVELTGPVIDYYDSSQRLQRVNGLGSVEAVFETVRAVCKGGNDGQAT